MWRIVDNTECWSSLPTLFEAGSLCSHCICQANWPENFWRVSVSVCLPSHCGTEITCVLTCSGLNGFCNSNPGPQACNAGASALSPLSKPVHSPLKAERPGTGFVSALPHTVYFALICRVGSSQALPPSLVVNVETAMPISTPWSSSFRSYEMRKWLRFFQTSRMWQTLKDMTKLSKFYSFDKLDFLRHICTLLKSILSHSSSL